MADSAIELRHVTKEFPGVGRSEEVVVAVDNMSLGIRDGEFFSLLGPSGCGKTTTLRMIAGLEIPTAGEIYIHGKEMALTPPYRRPVNTVFQHYALFPHMTVGENIGFGLEMKKTPKEEIKPRVREALEMVRLPGMQDRRTKQLSGGQQQRVALARALINRPEVLLLDEPLGALDLKLRKEMQLELKQLQEQVGITFIYVTHDQEEALTMSDRIAVMNEGLVLQVGTPVEIYEAPKSRFVADFIGETNFLDGTVLSLDNGQAEFESAGLKMVAGAEPGLKIGAQATLAVRPERVRLSRERPDDTPNVFRCEVQEVIYVGDNTHYRVSLAPTISLRVRQQNSVPVGMPILHGSADGELWLSWHPASARVLAD